MGRPRVALPQSGGCACGDVRYRLEEEPLTLYVCHCTDCQRMTGSSFALTLVVRREALRIVRGLPQEYAVQLEDGRRKGSHACGRCRSRIWGHSKVAGLAIVEPGTLDDTSWLRPVGHIWTRSAQAWFPIAADSLRFEMGPPEEGFLELVHAWREAANGDSGRRV